MRRVKGSGRGGTLAPTPRVAISSIPNLPVIKSKTMATAIRIIINKQLTSPAQNTPAPQAKANTGDVSVNTSLY